jgi:hypothetical protein
MDPEKHIRGSGYPPEVIEVLMQAFNEVWENISHNFISQQAAEDARDRLARIILAYATDDPLDATNITSTARLVMVMNFPGITPTRREQP